MGKETISTTRNVPKPKIGRPYTNTKVLQMEFTKQWSSQEMVFRHEVVENICITVHLQTPEGKVTLLCQGFNKQGNNYKTLLAELQLSGVLSLMSKVKMFQVLGEDEWEIVDPEKDTFQGNATIRIELSSSWAIKKGIKKVRKSF